MEEEVQTQSAQTPPAAPAETPPHVPAVSREATINDKAGVLASKLRVPGQPAPEEPAAQVSSAGEEGAQEPGSTAPPREDPGSDPPAAQDASSADADPLGIDSDMDDPFGEGDPPAPESASAEESQDGQAPDYEALVEILGPEASNNLNKAQLNKIWHSTMGTPRGKKIYGAYKFKQQVEEQLGRQIDDPAAVANMARDSGELQTLVRTLHQGGEDGARQVFDYLTLDRNGNARPWRQHFIDHVRGELGGDIERAAAEAKSTHTVDLINQYSKRAANYFRNGNEQQGKHWLAVANSIHWDVNREGLPNHKEISEGRFEPLEASSSPQSAQQNGRTQPKPDQARETDPEREQLRLENERLRTERFQAQAQNWGRAADDDLETVSKEALKGLASLRDNKIINERVYQTELDNFQREIYAQNAQEIGSIAEAVKAAIKNNDAAAFEFQRGRFRRLVSGAAQRLRRSFLEPYRDKAQSANASTQRAVDQAIKSGEKVEAGQQGSPTSPAVSSKAPTGTVAGNADWMKNRLRPVAN